jgi:hypothetical protein
MTINPVTMKLRMKPGMHALIVGAPSGYLKLLAALPIGVEVSDVVSRKYEFVQFFATRYNDIRRSVPGLLRRAASGAVVWIAYPKKTSGVISDLSRDAVCEAMRGTGWRSVAIIAIDGVWSAVRFRPSAKA